MCVVCRRCPLFVRWCASVCVVRCVLLFGVDGRCSLLVVGCLLLGVVCCVLRAVCCVLIDVRCVLAAVVDGCLL